jgi:hypothetical protein
MGSQTEDERRKLGVAQGSFRISPKDNIDAILWVLSEFIAPRMRGVDRTSIL